MARVRSSGLLVSALFASACSDAASDARAAAPARASEALEQRWVTAERLNRRTCPSTDCGVVGKLFHREAVRVHEERDGWVRVTRPYGAMCVNGKIGIVDTGEAACTEANGVEAGMMAEWVSAAYLSAARPGDPAAGAQGRETLVAASDDYAARRTAFLTAAETLIASDRCTEADFRENGGFTKSTNGGAAVYFVYCGGTTVRNRLYLDADTGEIYR